MSTAVKINQYDLPSRNAFCLALAIIAAIAIFVNIHTRTAYVSAEAQVMVSQPLVEKDSFHMTPSKKRKSFSLSSLYVFSKFIFCLTDKPINDVICRLVAIGL